MQRLRDTEASISAANAALQSIRHFPNEWCRLGLKTVLDGISRSAAEMLILSDVTVAQLQQRFPEVLGSISANIAERVEIENKYASVVEVQREE
ncbi:MAG: hypothetical protein J0J09_00070, partial [Devosia sp.]|nr:hypothetical protein [Devosia sp.]